MDDVRAIGPPIALALLTVFYGLLFTTFVWRPTEHRMEAQALSKS
jgi:flagellar motor component MotA